MPCRAFLFSSFSDEEMQLVEKYPMVMPCRAFLFSSLWLDRELQKDSFVVMPCRAFLFSSLGLLSARVDRALQQVVMPCRAFLFSSLSIGHVGKARAIVSSGNALSGIFVFVIYYTEARMIYTTGYYGKSGNALSGIFVFVIWGEHRKGQICPLEW